MKTIYTDCSKCGEPIKYGEVHVSISRNIERAEMTLIADCDAEIEVIDSVEIICLCERCGKVFDPDTLEKLIMFLETISSLKPKKKKTGISIIKR